MSGAFLALRYLHNRQQEARAEEMVSSLNSVLKNWAASGIIRIKVRGADRVQRHLRNTQKEIARATVRALNRTGTEIRTRAVRMLQARTGYQQKLIRTKFTIIRANAATLTARVSVRSKAIPLIKLPARQTPAGVVVNAGSRRIHLPSAFIATMPTGHRGIYQRKKRRRLPIREMYGPNLAREFEAIYSELRTITNDLFQKNFKHEMSRIK